MSTKTARQRVEPSAAGIDGLTAEQRDELRALDQKAEHEIDLSDIPEVLDWSGAERGKFYKPVKQQITLRVDADVLAWFRHETPRGYQSAINAALRQHVAGRLKSR